LPLFGEGRAVPSLQTPLTRRLGIDAPVVQAPIGSATGPELAVAVSEAGGLGTLAVTWRDPGEIAATVASTWRRTDGPVGANVVVDPDATDTPTDALVDAVVAQGVEAGGHLQSDVSTMALVPRVVDVVDCPVVAAGGIGDGRGLAAVLALGADAGWLGTRFVTTQEARVHERYRRRVVEASETDTASGTPSDGGWPDVPHRVVRNQTVETWESAGRPPRGERPGEDDTVARVDGAGVGRYEDSLATPDATGDVEELPLYAGQSSGVVAGAPPAGEVVDRLTATARATIEDLPR
jgi:nitronate monooxygenase